MKGFQLRLFTRIIFLTLISNTLSAQSSDSLHVIRNFQQYKKQVSDDSTLKMVELKSFIPKIFYDLRYATKNNFTHQQLYPKGNKTYLRIEAAKALAQVQNELNEKGLGLKIFDAYRPYSVTVKMWELIKDGRYVADPKKGSGHNRGIAVDCTIIQLDTKKELNMGTGFDNFTDTAHQDFAGLPKEVLANRQLLKTIMERNGFIALPTEWWHFYFANGEKYDVLDIGFEKLGKKLL
jgi:D-alanyl-D-alanine dipeptidase